MDNEFKRIILNAGIIASICTVIAYVGFVFELFLFFVIVIWCMFANAIIYMHWLINKGGVNSDTRNDVEK